MPISENTLHKWRGRLVYQDPHPYILTVQCLKHVPPGTIDYEQLDEQIKCVPETEDYLYSEYTTERVAYREGSRPFLEAVAEQCTHQCGTDEERCLALMDWCHARLTKSGHSGPPPGSTEEEMIQGPYSLSCNLTSRVYCMLVQTLGISSRMVFLYSSRNALRECEHTVAEAFAEGRWCVIDPRQGRCYRRPDGLVASARELQSDPTIMTKWLTEDERQHAQEHGGALDPRLFHEFALCNYLITDSRPARTEAFARACQP